MTSTCLHSVVQVEDWRMSASSPWANNNYTKWIRFQSQIKGNSCLNSLEIVFHLNFKCIENHSKIRARNNFSLFPRMQFRKRWERTRAPFSIPFAAKLLIAFAKAQFNSFAVIYFTESDSHHHRCRECNSKILVAFESIHLIFALRIFALVLCTPFLGPRAFSAACSLANICSIHL